MSRAGTAWLLGASLAAAAPAAAQDADPRLVSRVDPGSIADTASAVLAEAGAAASADGRFVAFVSRGMNLVPGQLDEVEAYDVFLRDRAAGQTALVSHERGAPLKAVGGGQGPVFISRDGGYVLFSSYGTALAAGQDDANGAPDLFLWERATGTAVLVSHRAGQPAVAAGVGHSYGLGLSADGRFALFTSSAPDLVAGQLDANEATDIFVWDRLANASTLVSRAAGSTTRTGSASSDFGRITPDGEHVLFNSQAEDLAPGQVDEYATWDIFLFHRPTGETRLVTHARGLPTVADHGFGGAVSDDGRYVAFSSYAPDLVAGQGDHNGELDVFLYDREADGYTLVSHRPGEPSNAGNDTSGAAVLSADGRWVAFLSGATDLGPGVQDDNGFSDVFLFDRLSGAVTLVSRAAGTTRSGNEECWDPVLSPDGRWLAFTSQAGDLVAGQVDANRSDDVFIYDVEAGALRLASHGPDSPARAGSGLFPAVTAGGGTVIFVAYTRELTEGLVHGQISTTDVFAYETATQEVSAVSVRHPSLPALAARGSFYHQAFASMASDDGRYVVFASPAEDLVPGISRVQGMNVYLHDRQGGSTRLLSHRAGEPTVAANLSSYLPTISGDGRFVAFASNATDLVAGQQGPALIHSVFLHEVATGATALVSHHPSSPTRTGNHESWSPVISADGRFVAFRSLATDLVARQRDNISVDVFIYDRLSRGVALVSHGFDDLRRATGTCPDVFLCLDTLVISRDGSYLAYTSASTELVPAQADSNGGHDVFVYERGSGINRLVSRAAAGPARAGNGPAEAPSMSADGRYLAFTSRATDHVPGQEDGNGASDVFVHDRVTGATLLASRAAGSATRAGDAASAEPALSADGAWVAFTSQAGDLVPGLSGPADPQVFVFAPGTGQAALVSHGHGAPLRRAEGASGGARLSRDGARVAFTSLAADLVPGQTGPRLGETQVFLHERAGGGTLLASHAPGDPGGTGNRPSAYPHLSADGDTLYFESLASNLAEGDYDYVADPYSGGTDPLFRGWDLFVFGFNRAPVALAQAATVREDASRALVLAGADADGDSLAYALASLPAHGSITGTPPLLTYVPAPGYHGPDGFTFTVSDGRRTSAPAAVAITVEPDSVVAAADAAVVEGDAGIAALTFTVTVTPPAPGPVSVSYQTEDGTASAGSDYAAASGTLAFAAGESTRTVTVAVNGDTLEEESETFTLRLLSAAGADVEGPPARGQITDDDDDACARPPQADIDAAAALCLNRQGLASVADAGAGASYAWTIGGGAVITGDGTPRITFAAEAPPGDVLALGVTVTNASGCRAAGSAAVSVTERCYAFHALAPCRAVDTRAPEGPRGGPALQANRVRAFALAGACGVPADAVAVAVNATVAAPTEAGNLRLFAGGSPAPLASALNFRPLRSRAGLALVPLGAGASLGVQCDMAPGSEGEAHLVLDAYGYFR